MSDAVERMSWSIWDRIQESEREEKNVMVKHLVMWNFKEDFPEEKKEDNKDKEAGK